MCEKMKKIILLLILGIFFISFISAQDPRFIGKQNVHLNIWDTCTFGDFPCSDNFHCNFTIENPNQEIIVLNEGTTRNQTVYNYTILGSLNSELGLYKVDNYCSDYAGNNGTGQFFYKITRTGKEVTQAQGLIYIIILGASFIIFLLCLIGGITIPWKNPRNDEGSIIDISYLKYLKVISYFFSYILFVWILNLLVGISGNYLELGMAYSLFRFLYVLFIILMFPIAFSTVWILFVWYITDKKIRKDLIRGFRDPFM